MAIFVILEVIEKHKHDSNNLFPRAIIKDLGHSFNYCHGGVGEELVTEVVVGKDPEGGGDVVANLGVVKAGLLQEFVDNLKPKSIAELSSQMVGLHKSHNCK